MLFRYHFTGSTLLSLWQEQRSTTGVSNRGNRRKIANCVATTTRVELVHYWIEVRFQPNGLRRTISHCQRRCHEFDRLLPRRILTRYYGQSGEKIFNYFLTLLHRKIHRKVFSKIFYSRMVVASHHVKKLLVNKRHKEHFFDENNMENSLELKNQH